MRPVEPIHVAERFAPLHAELIALLSSLSDEEWNRPAVKRWSVRDVAAHLNVGWDLVKDIQKRDLSRRYAFERIEIPIFERVELFARGLGESSDAVEKEMFRVGGARVSELHANFFVAGEGATVYLTDDATALTAVNNEASEFLETPAIVLAAPEVAETTQFDPMLQFTRWFDLMGVQRHLKAIGIFARLARRDGKPSFGGVVSVAVIVAVALTAALAACQPGGLALSS